MRIVEKVLRKALIFSTIGITIIWRKGIDDILYKFVEWSILKVFAMLLN